jgi:hypothetical protein
VHDAARADDRQARERRFADDGAIGREIIDERVDFPGG